MEAVTGMPFSAAWLCFAMGLAQSCAIEALWLGGATGVDCACATPMSASDATKNEEVRMRIVFMAMDSW